MIKSTILKRSERQSAVLVGCSEEDENKWRKREVLKRN